MLSIRGGEGEEILDEFGFIKISPEEKKERTRMYARLRYLKGGATIGIKNVCRDRCIHLPHRSRGEHVSFRKTGEYWCKECERKIRCNRCHCCGNLGRKEPRHRDRSYHTRIE